MASVRRVSFFSFTFFFYQKFFGESRSSYENVIETIFLGLVTGYSGYRTKAMADILMKMFIFSPFSPLDDSVA